MNPQNQTRHASFRQKHNLPFPLLVDKGQKTAKLYRANGLIVKRTVYLIGVDGKIIFGVRGAPPSEAILASLK